MGMAAAAGRLGSAKHQCKGAACTCPEHTPIVRKPTPSGPRTSALDVSSDTLASSTPGVPRSAASAAPEQVAQAMPPTDSSSVAASSSAPMEEQAKPESSIAASKRACTRATAGGEEGAA